ncbi:hypothetical protein LPTSP4_09540 [Leptospira ryugenii]|uniref:Uncharacterized protein n=1 Tax=Leptospira ryugenii TaxID=1917863 RepID=A0A2P2DXU0_9LEPT|nr:hypothetical protein [Leptospira ryugenii]GBF49441.1 hypothetical protein LPTSP4_09540 [Leptospira ryugenii]
MGEVNDEFIVSDWNEFQADMEADRLLDIDAILQDYYSHKIGLDDILSTFPPSELPLLEKNKHRQLITKYFRLMKEFPDLYGESYLSLFNLMKE